MSGFEGGRRQARDGMGSGEVGFEIEIEGGRLERDGQRGRELEDDGEGRGGESVESIAEGRGRRR